jgi:nitrite reductase/ring-hydroxylating ferredoxin subunit
LGALALGLGAPVLVACGAGDDATSTATGDAPPFDPTPPTPRETQDPTESEDPTPSGAPLVAAAAVPVGSGVILAEEKVVVTQPAAGEFHAFTAVCPHAEVILSEVSDADIYCGDGHGSRFTLDGGAVLNGPATTPLARIAVKIEGDQVVRA